MSKDIAKKAAASAIETTVMALLPTISQDIGELRSEMKSMRIEVAGLDGKIQDLTTQMNERFERTQEVVNELSHRITRLNGRIDGFMEAIQLGLTGKGSSPRKLKLARGQ